MTDERQLIAVQDRRIILSSLWIFVMFNMAFADIIGFIEPGTLERIISGEMGFQITPLLMVIISLVQVIPIAMIPVSRLFRRDVNRWLNIGAGALTVIYVLGGGDWEATSYFVFAAFETVALLVIIWLAWRWKA